jgi:CheY-like chemotaxis protein
MAEQNVVETPSQSAPDDFGSQDFGNQDFGEGDSGSSADGVQHGQGQSKSSRRRRRKRKGKGPGDGVAGDGDAPAQTAPLPFVMEGESLALAASAAPASAPAQPQQQQQRRQNNPGGGQQPQGQITGTAKRWKKKFRDRERRPGVGGGRSENPGNDFRAEGGSNGGSNGFSQNAGPAFNSGSNYGGGGGGFKRKGKQGGPRKERSFVGPMDHSYREVNGNFADPSASTIPVNGFGRKTGHRHHGDSQPIDHSMPRAIPIPEGAQTHIYFFIEDLFFTAKIQETARKQGVKVAFVKNEKEAVAALTSGDEENKPALIVFDLNNVNAKPLTLIPKLKAKLKKTVSIVGFLSHLQGDLKAKAVEAGCDAVMPRAAFSQNLPNLLRRYSVEEGEEVNYNQ